MKRTTLALMALPYPSPTSPEVTERMQRVRRVDTKIEVSTRSALHTRGLRFRKDFPVRLPERVVRPDVVFPRLRIALFIDGCFWHCCPDHGTTPRANTDYWRPKLARNVARDRLVDSQLEAAGWDVIRAWEHEEVEDIANRVEDAIGHRRDSVAGGS
jgi:DNA mismatch endonuclease (patch repair protein)